MFLDLGRITFDFLAAPVIQSPKRTKAGERGVRVAMDDWAKKNEIFTKYYLIINFKAVMMSYCLCFMLLWLNAKNNFQLNQQKLILNHELSFNVFGNNTKKECTYAYF